MGFYEVRCVTWLTKIGIAHISVSFRLVCFEKYGHAIRLRVNQEEGVGIFLTMTLFICLIKGIYQRKNWKKYFILVL